LAYRQYRELTAALSEIEIACRSRFLGRREEIRATNNELIRRINAVLARHLDGKSATDFETLGLSELLVKMAAIVFGPASEPLDDIEETRRYVADGLPPPRTNPAKRRDNAPRL
jgi:hypothetical protein